MTIEQSVVTACGSLFSGGFYPAGDPGNQNPTPPYGTYQVVADQELDRYLTGRTTKAQMRVQINVYAFTASEVSAKTIAVRAALESAFGDQLTYYERGADVPGDETSLLGRYIDAQITGAA